MFELPEYVNLAAQITGILIGKKVRRGELGNSPHKFVWYNRTPAEFEELTRGKAVGTARARGKWLFIPLTPGYLLLFGECGGKLLYQDAGSAGLKKYHLRLTFDDGSSLTAFTQMWGAMELHEAGREEERKYIKGMKTTPVEPGFTFEYFSSLIDTLARSEKRSVKGLLTQDQLIPGLGNSLAQDIMFRSGLHPKHPIGDLDKRDRKRLYGAIVTTIQDAIAKGGRNDEYDLYNRAGKYVRVMDSKAAGKPCPRCGHKIEKIQYLGGVCYFCHSCQK